MKKYVGFLFALVILCQPIHASANSLSYIVPEEVDGIPTEISQNAEVIGSELNICPELLEAIAYYESSFRPTVTNGNCKGLMQVNPNIHKTRFTDAGWTNADWSDAYKNMYVAADYLSELFERYEDVAVVLAVYHGEKDAVEKSQDGYMSKYVQKILTKSEELERVHGK